MSIVINHYKILRISYYRLPEHGSGLYPRNRLCEALCLLRAGRCYELVSITINQCPLQSITIKQYQLVSITIRHRQFISITINYYQLRSITIKYCESIITGFRNTVAGCILATFNWGQLLYRNVKQFRGGLVFKAHRLWHHSTLGARVMKKKRSPFERYSTFVRGAVCHVVSGTFVRSWLVWLQGYLAHKNRPPPRITIGP